MYQHTVDLRALQLQPVFERRDDIVYAMHGQRVG
jgi:hypothetical protein